MKEIPLTITDTANQSASHKTSRVLIFEMNPKGHRLHYASVVIQAILDLKINDIVFATSDDALETASYREYIAPLESKIQISTHPVSFSGSPMLDAIRLIKAFRKTVRAIEPDHIYVPTADGFVQLLGIANRFGFRTIKKNAEMEVLIMRGHTFFKSNHWWQNCKRFGWTAALKASAPSVIHVLDPILHDMLAKEQGLSKLKPRLMHIPEPVEELVVRNRFDSRKLLGLLNKGRYLGFFGKVDARKGGDLLLAAFAKFQNDVGEVATNDRLLLMGQIDQSIRQLIKEKYKDLVNSGRIVIFDRFVSQEELELGLSAVDVVCVPYPNHEGSSGFVVRASSAERLILATDRGWIGSMVKQFDLGEVCDVKDIAQFSVAILDSLNKSQHFKNDVRQIKFGRYHNISNANAHWTARIRTLLGFEPDQNLVEWESIRGPF